MLKLAYGSLWIVQHHVLELHSVMNDTAQPLLMQDMLKKRDDVVCTHVVHGVAHEVVGADLRHNPVVQTKHHGHQPETPIHLRIQWKLDDCGGIRCKQHVGQAGPVRSCSSIAHQPIFCGHLT